MSRYQDPTVVGDVGNRKSFQAPFKCSHCGKLSIGQLLGNAGEHDAHAKTKEFWDRPSVKWTPASIGGKDFPDVPAHIASAADEAYECRSIDALRASILLARGVVEAVAKDRGITTGSLYEKIESLHKDGYIREFTRDAAHELRFLGNDMAHGDFVEPVDEEDAESVLDVMSEILNEVFQGPARVARMRNKRTGDGVESAE